MVGNVLMHIAFYLVIKKHIFQIMFDYIIII